MDKYNQILLEALKEVDSWDDLKPQLENLNTVESYSTKKKTIAGKVFEYFTKYYFLTEPQQKDLFEKVWLYDEIPLEVSRKLKLPSVDHGIDLLLKGFDGDFHAVQCKFKNDESKKLSWSGDKIANVFALATNCEKVIVFTNVADVTIVAKNFEDKYSQITYEELINIESDVFQNIKLLVQEKQPEQLSIFKPMEHQELAIENVVKHFVSRDRGQLILPCGAGKTLTALWIKEKLDCTNTLVLLPSLALLKQIKNDWSRNKSSKYRYMCVCSEKDIDKDVSDSIVVHTYEIGGPVSTDYKVVKDFLLREGKKVVFSTYQSLQVIQDACLQLKNFEFDLTICDEAHRTAGSKNKNIYTIIHDNAKVPSVKRMYMTATPRVATTALRNKIGDEYELLCDMSNPKIFGEEAFRMTFGEAITKKILVDYKIIGIGVTDKQVQKFIEERNYIGNITIDELAHNFSLNLVMNKYKAFHALSFHSRVQLAKEFAIRHKEFFNDSFAEYVEGKQTTTHRAKVLHNFKFSKRGVVSNARCLTEGVDVPTIDLIYFCDPKTSKIDIVQASGRALRTDKSGNKEMGYIVVPLFHHISDDIENEIKRKPIFNYLIQVVRSLCDQDERLQSEIDSIAFKKGKKGSSKIEIDISDEETERIIKFEGLEQKLKNVLFDEIIEKNKDTWEVMFMRLKEYVSQKGHMNVSKSDDPKLQNWIYERRRRNRDGTLDPNQKKRLDEIGFDWKNEQFRDQADLDDVWWQRYEKLIEYFNDHGHSNVPARNKKGKSLGTWVVAQRVAKRNNNLSKGRAELLDELKFDWNPQVKVFEDFCDKLIEFKKKYGHTEVPIINKEFPKLGRWTNTYRVILNNGVENEDGSVTYNDRSLSKEQIDRLKELGFKTSVRIRDWYSYYEKLKEFYEEFGHSKPSQSDNETLYYWCYRTRKQKSQLDERQLKLLAEIEFDFTLEFKFSSKGKRQNWEERLIELQLFYEENQHYNLTAKNEVFEGLYLWLVYQRRQYLKGKLTDDKISDLKNIGFDFSIHFNPEHTIKSRNDEDFDSRFEELKEYYINNGTFYISSADETNKSLLLWLKYQRKKYREGKLSQDNVEKLINLGYSFDITYRGMGNNPKSRGDESWLEKLEELKQYYDEYATFLIPSSLENYSSLQAWVRYQRKQYKDGKLDNTRIEKLKSIGFDFDADFRGRKVVHDDEIEKGKEHRNSWEENYLKLLDYKIKFGHCDIPRTYENKALAYFAIRQRHYYNSGKLTEEQIKKLELLGFKWEVEKPVTTAAWESNFEKLKNFFEAEGHSHYIKSDGDETLYHWVLRQRMDFRKNKLEQEKIELLNSLNFIWDVAESQVQSRQGGDNWFNMYEKLKLFKSENGHCIVPQIYDKDKSLGRWVNDQRVNKRKDKLSQEREDLLNTIEFVWDKKEFEWNQKFKMLQEFKNEFGHFELKQNDKGYEGLYYWLYKIKKEGTSDENKKKLESIGYEFVEYNPTNWFEMFSKVANHKEIKGDLIFSGSGEDLELEKWIRHQKILISRSDLPKDKIDILAAIGINHQAKIKPRKKRDNNTKDWWEMLDMLKDYHKIHGDFNVPKKYPINQALSSWLYYQKTLKRTDKLESEKIIALESIGFEFPTPLQNQKSWDERFEELLDYKNINGDCRVPVRYKENQQLATWVRTQRRNFKEETIDDDKKQKLNDIDFIWKVND